MENLLIKEINEKEYTLINLNNKKIYRFELTFFETDVNVGDVSECLE